MIQIPERASVDANDVRMPANGASNHTNFLFGHLIRYTSFVLSLSTLTVLVFLGVPYLISSRMPICTGLRCIKFEDDLFKSLHPDEDPCRNFHDYVCKNWNEKLYPSLHSKYAYLNVEEVLKHLFQADLKRKGQSAFEKAAALMLKCGSLNGAAGVEAIRSLLKGLKLSWPYRTRATRLELLDTLVTASLEYAIPMLFAFKVGRHPIDHQRNVIYIAVDNTFFTWITHIAILTSRGTAQTFLRRCAEVVGSSGLSYSRMISDVLWAHQKVLALIREPFGIYVPLFHNLSDFQLRVAINRHLPDCSQLWPADEIVNFHPKLFFNIRQFFRSTPENLKRLKLYMGVYVVWYIIPFSSYYLTRSMMEDMGHGRRVDIYISSRCYQVISELMPLVVWKIEGDLRRASTKKAARDILHMIKSYIYNEISKADANRTGDVGSLLSQLSMNAFNETTSWGLISRVYSYVPDLQGDFMAAFLAAARSSVDYFKKDISEPDSDITFIPGMVGIDTYRLLVNREIRTPSMLQQNPLFFEDQRLEVKMGTLGVHFAYYTLYMLYYAFVLDERFVTRREDVSPFFTAVKRSYQLFKRRPLLEGLTSLEQRELFMIMLAVNLARAALLKAGKNQTQVHHRGAGHIMLVGMHIPADNLESFTQEQLFFISSCLTHCKPHHDVSNVSVCNMAVAQACRFREAFGCARNATVYDDVSCYADDV